jgi:hypothetical protein
MSIIQILEHEIHKKIWSMHEFHTHTPRPAPGDNLSVRKLWTEHWLAICLNFITLFHCFMSCTSCYTVCVWELSIKFFLKIGCNAFVNFIMHTFVVNKYFYMSYAFVIKVFLFVLYSWRWISLFNALQPIFKKNLIDNSQTHTV